MNSRSANVAAHLPEMARQQPETPALHIPCGSDRSGETRYQSYSFAELDRASSRMACALEAAGVRRGVRSVLMVPPSFEFFALTFALFKVGAVPVLVDPGIGVKNLKTCLAEAQPEAFIGIPKAHLARVLLGWGKPTVKILLTVGRRLCWGGAPCWQLLLAMNFSPGRRGWGSVMSNCSPCSVPFWGGRQFSRRFFLVQS